MYIYILAVLTVFALVFSFAGLRDYIRAAQYMRWAKYERIQAEGLYRAARAAELRARCTYRDAEPLLDRVARLLAEESELAKSAPRVTLLDLGEINGNLPRISLN
ncbi:MAG TPA: hypothetical protein VLH56_19340 [Dissulfurispiraceae bacterium]|nr:hypothetical protein [Dissulfurispiraceae bacterium]